MFCVHGSVYETGPDCNKAWIRSGCTSVRRISVRCYAVLSRTVLLPNKVQPAEITPTARCNPRARGQIPPPMPPRVVRAHGRIPPPTASLVLAVGSCCQHPAQSCGQIVLLVRSLGLAVRLHRQRSHLPWRSYLIADELASPGGWILPPTHSLGLAVGSDRDSTHLFSRSDHAANMLRDCI
ncbi:hypothetical protein B0H12DRAFT_494499 [Mycena haematopus]|nr:hypothetical protein B0H12DRAFT_494499 [Mycena haematopus]